MIPDEVSEHREKVKLRSLHHRLANEKVRLNDTIGENNYLKVEIDIMRKEILFAKDSIKVMEEQIRELKGKASAANKASTVLTKKTAEHNNWILSLKCKCEQSKEQFEHEVKKLQERLQERYESENVKEEDLDGKKNQKTDNKKFDNPIEIMKIRVKNINAKTKQKEKLLTNYTRNAAVVEEAFKVIKEGSGITNIDEIVTAFIKAEEQNYALWNYVNQLGGENDILEDRMAHIDKEIARYEAMARYNNSELKVKVREMREQAEDLKKEILLNTEEVDNVQGEFDDIQGTVRELVKKFNLAKFSTKVGSKMQYNEETTFNEANITNYLAELEEYFATLIAYLANQKGDSNAAISYIPLDQLNEKMFNKKEMQIQCPYEANTQDEQEEGETQARKLYNRFIDLMGKDEMQILY